MVCFSFLCVHNILLLLRREMRCGLNDLTGMLQSVALKQGCELSGFRLIADFFFLLMIL